MTSARRMPRAAATALAITLVLAPWSPGLAQLLMLGTTAVWLCWVARPGEGPDLPPLLLVLAAVPLAHLVSTATALDPSRALVLTLVATLGWCCAATTARLDEGGRRSVLHALVLSSAVLAGIALTGLGDLTSVAAGSVVEGRLQGPFAQPNELGAWCALVLPVAVVAAADHRRGSRRTLLWCACLPLSVALVLSLSRGAWAAAAVAAVVVLACRPGLRWPALVAGAGLSATGIVLVVSRTGGALGVVLARLTSIGHPGASPADDRPQIWDLAVDTAAQHLAVGVGPGGMPTAAKDSTSNLVLAAPDHAHNLPLTALAEGGLVGAAALLLALVAGSRALATAVRAQSRGGPALPWDVVGPLAALTGAMVHGLIDVPWRNPAAGLLLWTLVGAVAASTVAGARPPRPGTTNPRAPDPTPRSIMSTSHSRRDTLKKSSPWRPLAWTAVALLALLLVVTFLPSRQQATAVVGLRGNESTPIASEDLGVLAHQYAIVLTDDAFVEEAKEAVRVPEGDVEVSVAPESATLEIIATASSPRDAVALANALATRAISKGDDDDAVEVRQLASAGERYTSASPPKLLLAGVGSTVIIVLAVGARVVRR